MKTTIRKLKRLIENVLNETEKTDPRIGFTGEETDEIAVDVDAEMEKAYVDAGISRDYPRSRKGSNFPLTLDDFGTPEGEPYEPGPQRSFHGKTPKRTPAEHAGRKLHRGRSPMTVDHDTMGGTKADPVYGQTVPSIFRKSPEKDYRGERQQKLTQHVGNIYANPGKIVMPDPDLLDPGHYFDFDDDEDFDFDDD